MPRAAPLQALAHLGTEHNVRVIVAGPWHAGTTWSVDHNGYAHHQGTTVGRLNILTAEALHQAGHTLHPTDIPSPSPPVPSPPAAAPPLRLAILGRPTLTTPADPTARIRRSGAQQIAVYLALQPDGASRTDLLELIFGHMRTTAAAGSLSSCLYELRRTLTVDEHSALQHIDHRYRLDPELVAVDWWQLQHHLHAGRLTQAAALYRGPIADGYAWDWLPEYRQRARHLIADIFARLARAGLGNAEPFGKLGEGHVTRRFVF